MNLDPKQKIALLSLGILVCFLAAGQRISDFVQKHTPPFKVGECFESPGPLDDIQFKVVDNSVLRGRSVLVGTLNSGGLKLELPAIASFEEIRELNPTKVECNK